MINAYVKSQELKLTYGQIVADSVNYIEFSAYFLTADWNTLDKFAHFQKGDTRIDIPLIADKISAEWGLNLDSGTWNVWLHGAEVVNGVLVTRITTDVKQINVKASGVSGELLPIQPPELAEVLQAQIGDLEKLETVAKANLVEAINEAAKTGNDDSEQNHDNLTGRDLSDQHPMSAITGLLTALDDIEQGLGADIDALADSLDATEQVLSAEIADKQPKGDYVTRQDIVDEAIEGSDNAITSGAVYRLLGNSEQLVDEIYEIVGGVT